MVKLACFSDIEEHFKAWVPALAKAIRDYPAGCGTEGKVEAQWYTRRGVKTVRWMVRTSRFTTSPPHIRLGPDARAEAFRLIFPERAIKMEILKKLRVLQRVKAVLPSSPVIRVKDVSERLRIGVVLTKELHYYLCTPIGCFCIHWWMSNTLADAVIDVLGKEEEILLSGNFELSWEDLEPLFVMAALAR